MSQVIKLQAPKFGIGEWVSKKPAHYSISQVFRISAIEATREGWLYECIYGGEILKNKPNYIHKFLEYEIRPITVSKPAKDE